MDAQNLLFIIENGSYRLNLIYTAVASISYLSYVNSASLIGFIGCAIYYSLFVGILVLLGLAVFCGIMFLRSQNDGGATRVSDQEDFFVFKDSELEMQYKGVKMPIEVFNEAYFAGKIDLKPGVDVHDFFRAHRHRLFRFNFTRDHAEFFVKKLLLPALKHRKADDEEDVAGTYNTGNDFYNSFLGESMVYTSGIYNSNEDSLEQAQLNKMDEIAVKIDLQPGDKHLDIGCGWGTFVRHCALNYGTDSLGVTLSKEQVKWHESRKKEHNPDAMKRAECRVQDYRDVPKQKFNKITALEMAEHVGVVNYRAFVRQIYNMLEDDGLFYIQICGLRPGWTFEDFVWGLFMAKYIFPGADASCPINWVVEQLERGGFEIHSVENVSIHYTKTIYDWYKNFVANKEQTIKKYDQKLYRVFEVFLAWSVLIGEQGTSACYQIVCNKNINDFDRNRFVGKDLANDLLTVARQEKQSEKPF